MEDSKDRRLEIIPESLVEIVVHEFPKAAESPSVEIKDNLEMEEKFYEFKTNNGPEQEKKLTKLQDQGGKRTSSDCLANYDALDSKTVTDGDLQNMSTLDDLRNKNWRQRFYTIFHDWCLIIFLGIVTILFILFLIAVIILALII
uniref:AsIV-cont00052-ORF1 n=1 Tax=Apophua simplicipes ichnovirus TaxID=1329648 RepID=S5DR66_9VIRU|nr:AsIV-cont00052-ORF1 [Apophua simplicipes ichnovirus]